MFMRLVYIYDWMPAPSLLDFGAPQGSILEPLLFNIHVSDLSDHIQDSTQCYQYADDTTVYKHCSAKGTSQSVSDLNTSLNTLNTWSTTTNLALNSKIKLSLL